MVKQEKKYTLIVTNDEKQERLDHFICKNIQKSFSRSFIQKLIKEKCVSVNGTSQKASYHVSLMDQIAIVVPESPQVIVEPQNIPLHIVYEDTDLCVINKEAHIVSHISLGHTDGTLVHALRYHCSQLSSVNGPLRPGIVHRLDKGTSGLMIIAKNNMAHESLAQQLASRTLSRKYLAVVCGPFPYPKLQVSNFIGRHPKNRKKMTVLKNGTKQAISSFVIRKRFTHFTLLEAILSTGRTHQIRVHLKHLGFPLCGDTVYYGKRTSLYKQFSLETQHPAISRQALHSYSLSFQHPSSKKELSFTIPLPKDIHELLQSFKQYH